MIALPRLKKSPIQQRLEDTANTLISKNLVPEYSKGMLTDPSQIKAAYRNMTGQRFKEYRCRQCNRTIFGPKSWMNEHVKTHWQSKEERDNEILITEVNPY